MGHAPRAFRAAALSIALLTACGSVATSSSPVPAASQTASPSVVRSPSSTVAPTSSATAGPSALTSRATDVLAALKARDGTKLATLVDAVKGVRFSPYPYVQVDKDVLLSAAELSGAFADPQLRTWGMTQGKGDEIRMTFTDYISSYAYDRDYLVRGDISNSAHGNGNTTDNTKAVYPAATLVEFYQPSSGNTLDWKAVRLLFEQRSGIWYLVAIVHGEWTI